MKLFPWWPYWIVLALIILVAMSPIGVAMVAAGIANAHGCSLSEGLVLPCIIDGVDRGHDLQMLGVSLWYVLLTWPLGLFLGMIWLIVLLIHRGKWKRRQKAAA